MESVTETCTDPFANPLLSKQTDHEVSLSEVPVGS